MMIKYKSDDGLENWKGRTMEKARQVKRVLLQAIKIAVGSSVAIYLAHILGLEYEASAGSITLLTLVTTKWETVKLSFYRMATFVLAGSSGGVDIWTYDESLACVWNLCISDRCGQS